MQACRHVVVDPRQQRLGVADACALIASTTLASRFSRCAMIHSIARRGSAIRKPCPGASHSRSSSQQRAQRCDVGGHVAVGRIDHDGRRLHHVIAGEERLLLLEQVADVVRRVAGRVDRRAGSSSPAARTARRPAARRRARSVASCHSRWSRQPAVNDGAGQRLQQHRRRRMVDVGVGGEDPADRPGRGGDDRVDVALAERARDRSRPIRSARRRRSGRCWCPARSSRCRCSR